MMKKLIGIMLVVLLLTGATALAEDDFRLHSGVRFGMTAAPRCSSPRRFPVLRTAPACRS